MSTYKKFLIKIVYIDKYFYYKIKLTRIAERILSSGMLLSSVVTVVLIPSRPSKRFPLMISTSLRKRKFTKNRVQKEAMFSATNCRMLETMLGHRGFFTITMHLFTKPLASDISWPRTSSYLNNLPVSLLSIPYNSQFACIVTVSTRSQAVCF